MKSVSWYTAETEDIGQMLLALVLVLIGITVAKSLLSFLSLDGEVERKSTLHRQITPIGRFTLMSETDRSPSIIAFFIALANEKGTNGIDFEEFKNLWKSRIMNKHERFKCQVSDSGAQCFEVSEKSFDEYCKVLKHPNNSKELQARVSQFLTTPLNIHRKLWECELSTGKIGASGVFIRNENEQVGAQESETILLFRNHHVLCDGVSLSTVVSDASDESVEHNDIIMRAADDQKKVLNKIGVLSRCLSCIVYYIVGSIYALSVQLWNMVTSSNPFDRFTKISSIGDEKRSVAWTYLTSVDEAKSTLKAVSSKHITLNALFVSILSSALEKQYRALNEHNIISQDLQSTVSIVCPVNLRGGIILPDGKIGNEIGAFAMKVPFDPDNRCLPILRLYKVAKTLHNVKHTPAAKISWLISYLISTFATESIAKLALVYANCHAVAAISNVHGFPKKIHLMARSVEVLCAFLPLPPRIPIGLFITSYDGKVIMSLNADKRIVPDGDRFLDFMIEEYEALHEEVESTKIVSAIS